MPSHHITLSPDDTEIAPAIAELSILAASLSEESRDRLELLLKPIDHLLRINPDVRATRAGEFSVVFEPTDRFRGLLAALRAGDADFGVFVHSTISGGCPDRAIVSSGEPVVKAGSPKPGDAP